jgi:hypothetical protein
MHSKLFKNCISYITIDPPNPAEKLERYFGRFVGSWSAGNFLGRQILAQFGEKWPNFLTRAYPFVFLTISIIS